MITSHSLLFFHASHYFVTFVVATKVEMRFNVEKATWIPEWVKPRLLEKVSNTSFALGYWAENQIKNQANVTYLGIWDGAKLWLLNYPYHLSSILIYCQEKNRITKHGELVITSDKTRKQILNQADCLNRIRTLIFDASKKPKEPTAEELAAKERRYVTIHNRSCLPLFTYS